ncbi:MAG TPA: flagellar biosynthetic protein FliR [Steroidobacteraceae bacterium]|nr:flagellar biosynthetic protein FliR [Steroidobacteraceae bacterium]HQW08924.1 flagellar biosynthetic protein FliR [Steroidobacteraceae bacterium]HQZ79689.1 flagellar biosynthetic protein FliR [Steroidobacteraceae bacterium]
MVTLHTSELLSFIASWFFPFVRIGACLMVAPVFGASYVPARMRLVLAIAIAALVAPLASVPQVDLLSIGSALITVQQIVIGVALGFALQIVFDAVGLAGQLLANSVGLSFAFNQDPLRGVSTPVVGQLYVLLVVLTFLALDGHLALIETLADGFRTLPVGAGGLGTNAIWSLVLWSGQVIYGALAVALPGMTAMLIVNLAFGVMSRAAPTLNLFAVGFPVTLAFGLVVILLSLPAVQSGFVRLAGEAFATLAALLR